MTMTLSSLTRVVALAVALLFSLGSPIAPPAAAQEKPRTGGVLNWFDSKKPLVEEEARYILRREDLVTLRTGRECSSFDGLIEQCLSGMDCFLQKRCRCSVIKASKPLLKMQ